LRSIATTLTEENGTASRLGGDQFALLLNGVVAALDTARKQRQGDCIVVADGAAVI
jgi:GGDEF domain-containing protein